MHENLLEHLKSHLKEVTWPAMPHPEAAIMLAMQYQLDKSQYMDAEWLRRRQLKQAKNLLDHAFESVPLYRQRIPNKIMKSDLDWEQWRKIPILQRIDLQQAGSKIVCQRPLQGHDKVSKGATSGSTGIPITYYGTQLTRFMGSAFKLRDHLWHQRDFGGKLASIRPEMKLEPGESLQINNWGRHTEPLINTGPAIGMSIRSDISAQIAWLQREKPNYLLSTATNLRTLAESGVRLPSLKGVRSYAEVLSPEIRDLCEAQWGVPVHDMYSSRELGTIGLQCPEHNHYHIQAESLLVEILDQAGRPCSPGETGRMIVTTLLNFVAPLIRYALGDYAEVGAPCNCGRGLPVIKRVLGRHRNMLTLPDGRKQWPSFPLYTWAEGLPVRQFRFVQTDLNSIEAQLVMPRDLSKSEEHRMISALQECFTYPFDIKIKYMQEIPRSQGGKYEDFMSMVQ